MLLHIYSMGRFGPEKHLGFIIAEDLGCIRAISYIGVDIVKSTHIREGFFTNPLGIGGIHNFQKWRRKQKHSGVE